MAVSNHRLENIFAESLAWITDTPACVGLWDFFDDENESGTPPEAERQMAKKICFTSCRIRESCLADALNNHVEWTIRGGYTAAERRTILETVPRDKWNEL